MLILVVNHFLPLLYHYSMISSPPHHLLLQSMVSRTTTDEVLLTHCSPDQFSPHHYQPVLS